MSQTPLLVPYGSAAAISTATSPTKGTVTQYTATAGPLAPLLPALSGLLVGDQFPVQKAEADTSANPVTLTCAGSDTFDSGGTTLALKLPGSQRVLQVVLNASGSKVWKVMPNGHDPLSALDNRMASITTQFVPCAERAENVGSALSNGTDMGGTFRIQHLISVSGHDLVLGWGNFYNNVGVETDGPNDITVRAALEMPDGSAVPVFFNGVRDVVIKPGSTAYCDPVPLDIAQGQIVYSRTYVTVATSGMKWPETAGWIYNSEVNNRSATPTDLTLGTGTTSLTNTFELGFGPVAFQCRPYNQPPASILAVGDSIVAGQTDYLAGYGWARRWLGVNRAVRRIAFPSSTTQGFAVGSTRYRRSRLMDLRFTHVLTDYPSINDTVRTLAQVQADSLTAWNMFSNRGAKVYCATLMPSTTSTDGWVTTAGQTVTNAGKEAVRVAVNAWLRGGAPLDPTTKAAVAVGTAGALVIGATGHPVSVLLDLAATAESAPNSGTWRAATTVVVASATLVSNVVTLTTNTAHGFAGTVAPGTGGAPATSYPKVVVAGVGGSFDGTYTLSGIPSTTTLTYAKTAANTTATGGAVSLPLTIDGLHLESPETIVSALPAVATLFGGLAS